MISRTGGDGRGPKGDERAPEDPGEETVSAEQAPIPELPLLPQLLQGDEYGPVRLEDLDEDVRQGRVGPDARLYHPPLTGEAWVALSELPAFAEALDTPNARFVWHLRRPRLPWMSSLWTLGLVLLGVAFLQLGGLRREHGWAEVLWADLWATLPVGAGAWLADGLWWTPWTSQLLHADAFHLLWNVGMVAYCGFRVERGLGPGGYLVVALASILGGALLIGLLGESLVLGSSVLAFGLWGGQIGIGVRAWGVLPRRFRGRYGTSGFVFLFFAGLYASGFYSARISHLGHLGGLLGGLGAALVVPGESFAPRAAVSAWRRRNLGIAALVLTLGSLLGPGLGRLDRVAWGPWSTVEPDGSGLSLALPARLQDQELRIAGLPAWTLPGGSRAPVFAGLTSLRGSHLPTDEELTDWWSRRLGGTATPLPATPRGDGWRSLRWRLDDTVQLGSVEVVEHLRVRGRWVVRTGYILPELPELSLPGPREAVYRAVLETVEVGEPPDLADIRARHARNPRAPRLRLELAEALAFAGELGEADALLAELSEREDAWGARAVRLRLQLWADTPELAPEDGLAWLLVVISEAGLDELSVHRPALSWLLARSHCDEARAHERYLERLGLEAGAELRPATARFLAELDSPLYDCGPTGPTGP